MAEWWGISSITEMFSSPCRTSRARAAQASCRYLRAAPSKRRSAVAARAFKPPTVSDTKAKFLAEYADHIPAMYNTVIQELIVQQHFMRHNMRYKYDAIFALGITSVFNQILDDVDEAERDAIFDSYIKALDEKPSDYRSDAEELTKLAEACSSVDDLKLDAGGSALEKALADVKARTDDGSFFYTRFFAIGLFRLLELVEARDPKALEGLVSDLGVKQESVNKDLLLYKSILSKMAAAKELLAEVYAREKRKAAEREAEKAGGASNNEAESEPKEIAAEASS